MKKTIGVTGGAGYIGSHVVHDLLERNYKVIVIDDLSTGNEANILQNRTDYDFIYGDIGNEEVLKHFFSHHPVAVMHFSAYKAAGESMMEPEKYSRNNIRNTCVLIENMHRHNCGNFIFSSTAAVYGMPVRQPVDEKHPIHPINYYGFTKLMVEKNLEWFSNIRGLQYASLRYFNAVRSQAALHQRGVPAISQRV
jgi:UDP-glucose 4-epimerase